VTPAFDVVKAVELVAVLACAVSGFAEARSKQMDVVGVFTVAFVTAFGGGTVRDILLDRRPFFWVEHYEYVILILVLTLLTRPLLRLSAYGATPKLLVVADAVGLAFFSITGVSLGLAAGLPWVIAAMMGVITGVVGGVLRDVILNEVPMVLRDGRPYALASFIGCWLYLLMLEAGSPAALAMWLSAALIVAVRLVAWLRDWTLH
jgi:uncharacterized membrane protein YeiH